MNATCFAPGALVRARRREWVVQPGSKDTLLILRPLGGSDEDIQIIDTRIELNPVELAQFPPPDPQQPGNYHSALLLRDALRLKLRAGAGPFRCFGHLAVEPRPYQLVPLLMALRQPVIRLLIADDVGIGKTIEAGLIIREMLDRGEIDRFAVLCPPHLVEQWVQELKEKFHLDAVPLTGATVARLERETPPTTSLFVHHKALVISLDYIKSDRHRDAFLANAPEMLVVDEAHTCTIDNSRSTQLRYQLIRQLAEHPSRHLLLLTATPHSGKESAFHNLLSLLKPEFANLQLDDEGGLERSLRSELAHYLIQRRRQDIQEWQDNSVFPTREKKDVIYRLTGEWEAFFNDILQYWIARAQALEAGSSEQKKLIVWYATLSMLRCVSSSPAAAAVTMQKTLRSELDELTLMQLQDETFDSASQDDAEAGDEEPATAIHQDSTLEKLIKRAQSLRGREGDPKLNALVQTLEELLHDGFKPVVFCRYIATADYVAEHLRERFKNCTIDAVTGIYTPEERKARIEELMASPRPILVATDCLSEGINLQEGFNAVVHYDLAWNPTRHEQREGRVDRFGQKSRIVRCAMLYGADNPVDGFVLKVIMKKAETIKHELGIYVPVPEETPSARLAQMKAMLLRHTKFDQHEQGLFDFADEPVIQNQTWQNELARMKTIRTIFAQYRIKPQEVWPEYQKQVQSLGDAKAVQHFLETALAYLQPGCLTPEKNGLLRFDPSVLPLHLRERITSLGITKETAFTFDYPSPEQAQFLHRSNPFVSTIADIVLETALEQTASGNEVLRRTAVIVTDAVEVLTRIYLLRLRHDITYAKAGSVRQLLAEESLPAAAIGVAEPRLVTSPEIEALLDAPPRGNLSTSAKISYLQEALRWYQDHSALFEQFAYTRADTLRKDHARVRDASLAGGRYEVRPNLPVDLVGICVLLPASL